MATSIALTGDSIINRRVSVCDDPDVQEFLGLLDHADIGITHLEAILHDFDREDIYPNYVAGGNWLHAPGHIADELATLGVDAVSHASNHALDYGYGGLFATWNNLDRAGIAHAGTGENLAAADAPTYVESGSALVGLVSMTTSFADAHRAGESRRDVPGRPGVNPLGVNYEVDAETRETLVELAELQGWWVTQQGDRWLLNPPGERRVAPDVYIETDDEAVSAAGGLVPRLAAVDRARNLAAIRDAGAQADLVVAHIHTHAWDPAADMSEPGRFLPPFAHACIDAGADIVLCQGTHTPMRGIEIYDQRPIFYDPGDFLFMTDSINRLPYEYYDRYGDRMDVDVAKARPSDAHAARGDIIELGEGTDDEEEEYFGGQIHNPPGGYFDAPVLGNFVPVCSFADGALDAVEIYPGRLQDSPKLLEGVPRRVHGEDAAEIIEHLADLSARYDTTVELDGDVGRIPL
ncbi:MAG: CapA family protein [Salinirussus sp.]